MKTLVSMIIVITLLYACSKSPALQNNRTAAKYFNHIDTTPATSEQDVKTAFGAIFSDLKTGATEANIRKLYADEFYFNDTLKIIENIDELVVYLTDTAKNINSAKVEILDVIRGKDDYFIRWSMIMNLKISGKEINSHSIGMTQLRFNRQGKLVFHQDFWDSSEAFYEHLPYFGSLVKKIRNRL